MSQGYLYAQTNYITPGFESPAKLVTKTDIDLLTLLANLLYPFDDIEKLDRATIEKVGYETINYFVERDPIDKAGFKQLSFAKCKHLVWVYERPKDVSTVRTPINTAEDLKVKGNVPVVHSPVIKEPNENDQRDTSNQHSGSALWQVIAAFAFGVVFIITMIVLAVRFPHPTAFQYSVFRITLALAASGVGALIPGLLSIDFTPTAGLIIRAAGALALFVIIYFFNPARYAVENGQSTKDPPDEENAGRVPDKVGASRTFSVKDNQSYSLPDRLLGADRCMYHFELTHPIIGDHAAKFHLKICKHVGGQPLELVHEDTHGVACGESITLADPWHLVLRKVERRRAYFEVCRGSHPVKP